jgi:excinuclease UvrABC ATPase subunit
MKPVISIRSAHLHNLKNISLEIPKNRLVVLCGLSGSGKSTLAFDILHKEGQRQYMESLGMVTFGLSKAPLDAISGLSPSISIDQNLTNHNPRSTVGTATEVFTYLRVLYARLGRRPASRAVTLAGESIVKLAQLSIQQLAGWLKALPAQSAGDALLLARPILDDLDERL